ncbi:MAG: TIGR03960 family B12-binding radical SAM protein [Planctomycetes bacterium]|nr:TIGR03960 family B12-binding radical SAM protein [Planctomycetota bacterium]
MLTDDELSQLLLGVQKPGRYIGGETNSVRKPFDAAAFRMALAFPDIYEIAMSHQGLQILYGVVNARCDCLAERVFMPWFDMEKVLREKDVALFALESRRPVAEFDVVGFSLQYEVCYTTVLKMLDMAGIPRRRRERRAGNYPLIIAGGPCAFNPEPLADFVDLFFVGDSEETLGEFIDVWKEESGAGPEAVVRAAARGIKGIYAPELFTVTDTAAAVEQDAGVPGMVEAAYVRDLDAAFYPTAPVVALVQAVHDRIALEVMRGCSRGCRFCQAGMTKRPVRIRSVANLLDLAKESYRNTGYDEISLVSLATGDYPFLEDLARRLSHHFAPLRVGLAFPSLRADKALEIIPKVISNVRKTTITVAAEAGTERLRTVINKGITKQDLLTGVASAFQEGWSRVKLYFMAGLPTETLADVEAAAQLVSEVIATGKRFRSSVQVTCSVSPFIPKPSTPFQWEPMASRAYLEEARELLRERFRGKAVRMSFHNIDRSLLEAALARGGRELGAVLEKAADAGSFLDAWDEGFDFDLWRRAFESAGIDVEQYACRRLATEVPLAWGHISSGVSQAYLLAELALAMEARATPDCREAGCHGCGLESADCLLVEPRTARFD